MLTDDRVHLRVIARLGDIVDSVSNKKHGGHAIVDIIIQSTAF